MESTVITRRKNTPVRRVLHIVQGSQFHRQFHDGKSRHQHLHDRDIPFGDEWHGSNFPAFARPEPDSKQQQQQLCN